MASLKYIFDDSYLEEDSEEECNIKVIVNLLLMLGL